MSSHTPMRAYAEWEWDVARYYPELREYCPDCDRCEGRGFAPKMNIMRLMLIAMRAGTLIQERAGYNAYDFSVLAADGTYSARGDSIMHATARLIVKIAKGERDGEETVKNEESDQDSTGGPSAPGGSASDSEAAAPAD